MDSTLIPTGELQPVAGTPFDSVSLPPSARASTPRRTAQERQGLRPQLGAGQAAGVLGPVATGIEPESGRVLEVSSTEPGVQFYSGNFLDGNSVGKGGMGVERTMASRSSRNTFPTHPIMPTFRR